MGIEVNLKDIISEYGTPLYVYDLELLRERFKKIEDDFSSLPIDIHYAIKANDNQAIIDTLHEMGGKFDTVSVNEVEHLRELGIPEENILFTPSCPSEEELFKVMKTKLDVHLGELAYLNWVSVHFPGRPVGLRINPGMEIRGNKKIATAHNNSKFGIPWIYKEKIFQWQKSTKNPIKGIHVHLGSDISYTDNIKKAIDFLFDIQKYFDDLEYIDIGGGYKIKYHANDSETNMKQLAEYLYEKLMKAERSLRIKMEPGKFLTAPVGMFLMKVNRVKKTPWKTFVCVNSGFNHFIRPMYYGAYHEIINLSNPQGDEKIYDVVGYLCEEDTFAYDRPIAEVKEGDILLLKNAGAYGRVMASRYNLRPLPKEVAIDGNKIFEI